MAPFAKGDPKTWGDELFAAIGKYLEAGKQWWLCTSTPPITYCWAFDQDPQQRLGPRVAEEDPSARAQGMLGAGDGASDPFGLIERHAAGHADVSQRLGHLFEGREPGERPAAVLDDRGQHEGRQNPVAGGRKRSEQRVSRGFAARAAPVSSMSFATLRSPTAERANAIPSRRNAASRP